MTDARSQAAQLLQHASTDVMIKRGHGSDEVVCNLWFQPGRQRDWRWPRLPGEFHGSGCTLAAALAGQLAIGASMEQAMERAQAYSQRALENAFAIAPGQLIPSRFAHGDKHVI
jgi:hydroxymethylpyrimidine/phosphomethylpyrimidine kinase